MFLSASLMGAPGLSKIVTNIKTHHRIFYVKNSTAQAEGRKGSYYEKRS